MKAPLQENSSEGLLPFLTIFATSLVLVGCNQPVVHDHRGDTDMGPTLKAQYSSRCPYYIIQDGQSIALKFIGSYSYYNDHPLSWDNPIEIVPQVFEDGNPITNTYTLSYEVNGSTLTSAPQLGLTDCSSLDGLSIDQNMLGLAVMDNSYYTHDLTFEVNITIDNVSLAPHNYEVKFVFPFGGYRNAVTSCDTLLRFVNVCPLRLEDASTPQQALSILFDGADPTNPGQLEWPRFQIIQKEDHFILFPYQVEDFEQ